MALAISFRMRAKDSQTSPWAINRYHIVIAAIGGIMVVLAYPLSSLLTPSEKELTDAYENGLEGPAYEHLRNRGVYVLVGLLYGGLAIMLTAAALFAWSQVKAYYKI
jgi:multisubunit Na+/H+ antiporter MnhB subunit